MRLGLLHAMTDDVRSHSIFIRNWKYGWNEKEYMGRMKYLQDLSIWLQTERYRIGALMIREELKRRRNSRQKEINTMLSRKIKTGTKWKVFIL